VTVRLSSVREPRWKAKEVDETLLIADDAEGVKAACSSIVAEVETEDTVAEGGI
jgi:hypothetical protein